MFSGKTVVIGLLVNLALVPGQKIKGNELPKDIGPGEDCGSGANTGTLIRTDIQGCHQLPCSVFPGSNYEFAITYRPAVTTNYLTMGVSFGIYNVDGWVWTILKWQPLPGTFIAGNQYRVATQVPIPKSIAGKTGYLAVIVYQGESDTVESRHLCRYYSTIVSPFAKVIPSHL